LGQTHAQTEKAQRPAARRVNGVVLDAGGLIAVERNDRRISFILQAARNDEIRIIVPASALAQVIRNRAKQVRLSQMMQLKQAEVFAMDRESAYSVGELLARTRTSDITDAHVVICAQHSDYTVVTSDPVDIERLDPELSVIAV
jgi:hypothetical protein